MKVPFQYYVYFLYFSSAFKNTHNLFSHLVLLCLLSFSLFLNNKAQKTVLFSSDFTSLDCPSYWRLGGIRK